MFLRPRVLTFLKFSLRSTCTISDPEDPSCIVPQCVVDMSSIPPGMLEPSVVIIGAGVAGLSAAQRLIQCGISSFKILEASERAGGRLKTGWLGDTTVELGAEEILGASLSNTIYTLAAQENLFKLPLKRGYWGANENGLYIGSDGRPASVRGTERLIRKFSIFQSSVSTSTTLLPSSSSYGSNPSDESLEDYFQRQISCDLKNETDKFNASRVYFGLMNGLSSTLGAPLGEVSRKYYGSRVELPGGTAKTTTGMGGILAPLVRGLHEHTEAYCKPVIRIEWGTAGGHKTPRAIVRCCDCEEIEADYVLVTLPLGVLKKDASHLFCPPLPSKKMDAVNSLGLGHMGRIFLEYSQPFWSFDENKREGSWGFGLAWSPDERKAAGKETWWTGVTGVEAVSKRVLCFRLAGETGAITETCSDESIAMGLTSLLRRFLRDPTVPRPTAILRSNWSSSPWYGGATTYLPPGVGPGAIMDVAGPSPCDCDEIPPILLFAGEHTHPTFYGTLHGARLSGIHAADKIIEMTKRFKGPPIKPYCPPCSLSSP